MAMKRGGDGFSSSVRYHGMHSDESYEQELKSLLLKKSINKSKGRIGGSGSGSSSGSSSSGHQSFGIHHHHHHHFRRNDYIERLVLETDTLPGLALLYNSTVAEIKKLNHLYTEGELHAKRIIKVPSRGILINLEDPVSPTTTTNVGPGTSGISTNPVVIPSSSSSSSSSNSTVSVNVSGTNNSSNFIYEEYLEQVHDNGEFPGQEINANDQMTLYLNTKDNLLQEIREKADIVAANSPILNGSTNDTTQLVLTKRKGSTLKWWHLLLPCLSFIVIFPVLLFLFQEHIFDEHATNDTAHSDEYYHQHSHPPPPHQNSIPEKLSSSFKT